MRIFTRTATIAAATMLAAGVPAVAMAASFNFLAPTSLAASAGHVFVANTNGLSVSNVQSSTGTVVATISGVTNQFGQPNTLAVSGTRLFVTGPNVVSVVTTAGAPVAVVNTDKYGFYGPAAITARSGAAWVVASSNALAKVSSAGQVLYVKSAANYAFHTPSGVAVDAKYVWVTNQSSSTITQVNNDATGTLKQIISTKSAKLATPTDVVSTGSRIYVANEANSTISVLDSNGHLLSTISTATGAAAPRFLATDTKSLWVLGARGALSQISLSSGKILRSVPASVTKVKAPYGLCDDGTHLWISSPSTNTLSELSATNGAFVRSLS